MDLMLCLLIKVKLGGITFQTEVSMLSATLGTVSSPQSMSITTTSTVTSTSNLELQEALRVPTLDNSCQRASSLTSKSGDTVMNRKIFKSTLFKTMLSKTTF